MNIKLKVLISRKSGVCLEKTKVIDNKKKDMHVKKKILMITLSNHTSFQDGVFSMYENLKQRYTISTLTIKNSSYPVPKDKNNYFVDAPLKPGITKGTFNLKEIYRMMRIIRNANVNTIYFESFHIWNYPIILYCKIYGIKCSHAINDVIPHEGDSHSKINLMINFLTAKLADRVILRSSNGYNNALKYYSKYRNKLYKVDLWYSFPQYCSPKGKTVLFFGRMNKYKGIKYLFELAKRTPDIQYVVAGKADDNVKDTVDLLKKLTNVLLNEEVIPYDKMHDYFYNAICIVLPYETATQSGVVLDAYKHSRPVVAFDVGALGEQIDNGLTGFLAKSGNIENLEFQLRKIIDMPVEQYEQMCEQAYKKGVGLYSAKSREKEFLNAIGVEQEDQK